MYCGVCLPWHADHVTYESRGKLSVWFAPGVIPPIYNTLHTLSSGVYIWESFWSGHSFGWLLKQTCQLSRCIAATWQHLIRGNIWSWQVHLILARLSRMSAQWEGLCLWIWRFKWLLSLSIILCDYTVYLRAYTGSIYLLLHSHFFSLCTMIVMYNST